MNRFAGWRKVRAGAAGASALYVGTVTHQRLRPMRHRLRYRVYMLLLDLDELPALAARLRWLSLDRFNLFSVHARDYGDGSGLRAWVDSQLQAAGLPTGGAIRLLTMPRVLGYAFNPLSVYFCHAPGGALQAVMYEVNNTFGERHSYLIEAGPRDAGDRGPLLQQCIKQLHVSPFLGLDLRYRFRLEPPQAGQPRLALGVSADDAAGPLLAASFEARRRPAGDGALLRAFVTCPLLTLKVIAAIHWEALRLVLKGARLHARPVPPPRPVTVVRHER